LSAALSAVLAATALAGAAPTASAAPAETTPRLKVLTYNAFLFSNAA
jgi:sphingomyelin phosphodiesterase